MKTSKRIITTSNVDNTGKYRDPDIPIVAAEADNDDVVDHSEIQIGDSRPQGDPIQLPEPWDKSIVIVVTTWNCAKWLIDCMDSITHQTAGHEHWGALILDDASNDHTARICAEYGAAYVRVRHNIGKAALINLASRMLNPDSILMEVDSDDSLADNAVAVMLNAWRANPDSAIIYSQYHSCTEDLHPRRMGHCKKAGSSLDDAGYISHLKTYRAGSLIEIGGLDESIRKSIDKDLVFRLQELSLRNNMPIVHIPEVLYFYRRRMSGSITEMRNVDATMARRKALRRRNGLSEDTVCIYSASQATDTGGPGIFWGRLLDSLGRIDGFHFVDNWRDSDVMLGNVRFPNGADHQRPWVLRVDGVCFNSRDDIERRNSGIRGDLEAAEGVVYQSEWGREMVTEYCGKANGVTAVIQNGVDLPAGWRKAGKRNRKRIIACARWGTKTARHFKRLPETIAAFDISGLAAKGYELIILGEHYLDESIYDHDGVVFRGRVPSSELWEEMRHAVAVVHLSWFDCCPNSVIEAMAASVPVIYCARGVGDIVGDAGRRVADCDPPHPCDISKPYNIDLDEVADRMRDIVKEDFNGSFPEISMKTCAEQYADVIRKTVKVGVRRQSNWEKWDGVAGKPVVASTDDMR